MKKFEYQLVGLNSGKVYCQGPYKSDCFRQMQRKYPGSSASFRNNLYPEPLYFNKIEVI